MERMSCGISGTITSKVITVDVSDEPLSDKELIFIYRWLDSFPFSKTKKTSANRDFSDGVMMAELIARHISKIINMRNYIPASAVAKKLANWEHLNANVFRKIRFQLTPAIMQKIVEARPGMIERVLKQLYLILQQGLKAVVTTSRKMENVKSRFMNIDPKNRRPSTVTVGNAEETTPGRPFSKIYSRSRSLSRPSYADRCNPTTRPRDTALQPSSSVRPTSLTRKLSTCTEEAAGPPSDSFISVDPKHGNYCCPRCLSENYRILLRPSTGQSSDSGSHQSATKIILDNHSHGIVNSCEEVDCSAKCRSVKPGEPVHLEYPTSSAWLPADDDDEVADTSNGIVEEPLTDEEEETGRNRSSFRAVETKENPCDGEDHKMGMEGHGDVNVNNCAPKRLEEVVGSSKPKRKVKRVMQYEYKEEFILNGAASYQLPSQGNQNNSRKGRELR